MFPQAYRALCRALLLWPPLPGRHSAWVWTWIGPSYCMIRWFFIYHPPSRGTSRFCGGFYNSGTPLRRGVYNCILKQASGLGRGLRKGPKLHSDSKKCPPLTLQSYPVLSPSYYTYNLSLTQQSEIIIKICFPIHWSPHTRLESPRKRSSIYFYSQRVSLRIGPCL